MDELFQIEHVLTRIELKQEKTSYLAETFLSRAVRSASLKLVVAQKKLWLYCSLEHLSSSDVHETRQGYEQGNDPAHLVVLQKFNPARQ